MARKEFLTFAIGDSIFPHGQQRITIGGEMNVRFVTSQNYWLVSRFDHPQMVGTGETKELAYLDWLRQYFLNKETT